MRRAFPRSRAPSSSSTDPDGRSKHSPPAPPLEITMKLFGSKATQQLTVTLDGKVVRPGEPIRAVVHIAGDPDAKSTQAVARLVSGHHWATETDDDDRNRTEVTWHDQTVVVDE